MNQGAPTGGCLCGAITYHVDGPLRDVLHCHCLNCRKISGNFVASSGSATEDLTISDAEGALRWFDLGYARYGFCSTCGSSLFWQGAEHADRTSIQAGSLDDASAISLVGVWFADEAQSHVLVDESVPHFAGNDDGADV
ncbi:MAG: GFA family protein [Acidimicrobiia bacterium]|nr:GFA family protein [Acidimicrobiia bacterium]